MDILENDLEEIIFDMFKEKSDLVYQFGCEEGIILRQPTLSSYGKMDLVNISFAGFNPIWCGPERMDYKFYREWNVNVIELKRGKVGYSEIGQLCRYLKGLKQFLGPYLTSKKDRINVSGIVIGKEVEQGGDFVYLLDQLRNIDVYTYKLDYKTGLKFERSYGWALKNVDFENTKFSIEKPKITNLIRQYLQNQIDENKSIEEFQNNKSKGID